MPFDDGKRYEIIDGELYVSKAPNLTHQDLCAHVWLALDQAGRGPAGGRPFVGPGLIFAPDEDVIPDVVWVSRARLPLILGADGHFHGAPELIVEVLSPGPANERRDREAKLNLYSRQGVREYWIVDWQQSQVQVFRRVGTALDLVTTVLAGDVLESPLLPGLALSVADLFADLPVGPEPTA